MSPAARTPRQLFWDLKQHGASEEIVQAIIDQRAHHPLDLAAKAIVGLMGALPTAKEGQLGAILVLRSLLHDALTMYGESDGAEATEDDLAIARMLLRDAESLERHLSDGPAGGT
jgi:hypothetical protein